MTKIIASGASKGFSLITLAVGLGVAGLLLAAYLHLWRVEMEKHKIDVTKQHMRAIHVALTRYVAQQAKLPCPESPAPQSTHHGAKGDFCAHNDDENPYLERNPVWTGVAPLHALHLNDENALDGWGNKFTYAVTRTLTLEKALQSAQPSHGVLQVADAEGRNRLSSGGARYVLISHGPSGAGGWTRQGVRRPCAEDTLDSRNCDGDMGFVQAGFSLAPGETFYDDVLLADDFKDRNTLEQLAWCNMRQAFYAPGDPSADADGCVLRKGVWRGACTLSKIDPIQPDWEIGNAQVLLSPSVAPKMTRIWYLDHFTSKCACPDGFEIFSAGEWDDSGVPARTALRHVTNDRRYPRGYYVMHENPGDKAPDLVFFIGHDWARTRLTSCTAK
ncbi:MAG: hypothetical protein EPN97_07690 [Alphaproteobacteria bacterium]|nr:MAG: hypothetical protein EPN97_07690 [Alphaproteobacteria bacterium]